jgi:hypothetical protein
MFPQTAQVNYFFIELRLALIAVQKSLDIIFWMKMKSLWVYLFSFYAKA